MKRFVALLFLFAIACGKEASVMPIVSVGPSPTAQVTYEPYTTPTPTVPPLITPTAAPASSPTPTPVPIATSTPASTTRAATTHADTPTNAPPDAYLRYQGNELKGEATAYNWQTSP